MRRTKIVATIGPASESLPVLRGLVRAGMDVARLNFSHGDHREKARVVEALRQVSQEEGRQVALLADLQGPKLRVGELGPDGMALQVGTVVELVAEGGPGEGIPVPHPELLVQCGLGQRILLDDGTLELSVLQPGQRAVKCAVVRGGILRSRKGISVPGVALPGSGLTPKDKEDVAFALAQGVDFLALSYVRRAADVRALRHLVASLGGEVAVVAKIEKQEALDSFGEILAEADAIMVARGDLGVETAVEEVPFHQKRIIRECLKAGKPVITATQMLQSMIENPTFTRAEASDVANAILDGTDAVMLSGETAVGKYPVEAVEAMARICLRAEAHGIPTAVAPPWGKDAQVTAAVSGAAVQIAKEVGACAIVTPTMTGTTARMVARHRPPMPVVAMTPSPPTLRRLSMVWGVVPVLVPAPRDTDQLMGEVGRALRSVGLGSWGEKVVLTVGLPFGGGSTNTVHVWTMEDS